MPALFASNAMSRRRWLATGRRLQHWLRSALAREWRHLCRQAERKDRFVPYC
ncbi:hypothetical protein [Acidovorax sp. SDU_ACID1]|uniref:hypothetical protein n=1 Tax=Acidovorax sp. SDU_ACID1 TaxID=3136632 RepID=UPI003872CEDB